MYHELLLLQIQWNALNAFFITRIKKEYVQTSGTLLKNPPFLELFSILANKIHLFIQYLSKCNMSDNVMETLKKGMCNQTKFQIVHSFI